MLGMTALSAWARGGGGEYYEGPDSAPDFDSDGGGEDLLFQLVFLAFRYPKVGIPLLIVGYLVYRNLKKQTPKARTQAAFRQREAELRTHVTPQQVRGWVSALKLKDPEFELQPLLDRTSALFLQVQEAWFRRDLSSVRPYLSDATYRRLEVQLRLNELAGVRDALAEVGLKDVELISLNQSEWFDSVQLRIRAHARDTDVPARTSDDEARALAARAALEPFTEVWTFVRRPGAKSRFKIGDELFDGKCPNCGAPYRGGATNVCEFCQAVINSGNYDWSLSEITQGTEHVRHHTTVDGLLEARRADAALNLEVVEDRTSLIFWKWVEAQTTRTTQTLLKVAAPELVQELRSELEELAKRGRQKVFLECAVGAVNVKLFRPGEDGYDECHVDIRWSARMGVGPAGEKPPELPVVPHRSVFVLRRKQGAQTPISHGVSTSRCVHCHGPLTDSLGVKCDYCGTPLSDGQLDWVVFEASAYEVWSARQQQRMHAELARGRLGDGLEDLADPSERERLLYMMAAVAAADGQVSPKELSLLKMCSERWSVPFQRVELALHSGHQMLDSLMPKQSPQGAHFVRQLVNMALIDGRIDAKERKLLESVAAHLGLQQELHALIGRV